MTLYIDEDSGVIRGADEAGEPFFAAEATFPVHRHNSGVLGSDRSQSGGD